MYDTDVKAFDWSQFRVLARLERKTDESLERYFNSFVNMCRTACKLPPRKDEGKNASLTFYFIFNYQILEIPLNFPIRNSWQQHILLSDIRLLNPPTVMLMLFCLSNSKTWHSGDGSHLSYLTFSPATHPFSLYYLLTSLTVPVVTAVDHAVFVEPLTEERAARTLYRIELLRKIREQVCRKGCGLMCQWVCACAVS